MTVILVHRRTLTVFQTVCSLTDEKSSVQLHQTILAKKCGVSVRTLSRAICDLVKLGLLRRDRCLTKDGLRLPDILTVVDYATWVA